MRERLIKVIKSGAAILAAGCAYLVFAVKTGRFIPCPFRLLTGFKCPGCGISHMFVCLARLDFAGAWSCNRAALIMLPLLLFFIGKYIYQWVRTGKYRASKAEKAVQSVMIAALLIFGVTRNLNIF